MASTLDRYCGSTFWNSSLLETETPDLTVCFEQTVLVWAPLSLLWLLAAPIQLANLWRVPSVTRPVQRRRFSFLYIAKQVTLVLLFVSAVAALGITLSEDFGPMCDPKPCDVSAPMLYVNPCLYMLTWLLLLVLGEVARRRGGGGLLFLFWLLLVLCGALPLQTLVRQLLAGVEGGGERHWVFFVSFGLQVQALVLSAFADSASEPEETKPCQFKPNPTARASFLNLITFTWFDKMVYRGYRRPLEMSDLCELDSEDEAGRVIGQLGRSWRREERRGAAATGVTTGATTATDLTGKSTEFLVMEPFSEPDVGYGSGGGGGDDAAAAGGSGAGGKPSLFRAMLRTYRRPLIESAIFKLIYDLLVFVNPQILKAMISFTDDPRVYEWKGYVYAVVLLITALLQSVLQQQYFLRCFLIGMRVRSATIGLVYQKSLTISNGARKRCAAGETVNLMSADAQRFMDVAPFLHLVWSAPLQIALSLAFLWAELGPASLAGLAVMVLVVPVNALLATRSRLLQMQNMKVKDERIKLMNEILNGIKILKYFAWEPSFEEMVTEIRDRELGVMKSFSYLTSVSFFIFALTPFLVSLASFGVYIAVDARHVLDAPRAFTSLALFNVMRYPMAMIPLLISFLVQAGVSVGRMEKFLMNDDIDASSIQKNPDLDCAIRIENASFAWEREDPQPTLKDLSLVIPFGSLVAVVGQVGSGKSSLIAAMLGEMERLHGSIELKGSLAYVPQQAWIQNATLQDNVLFGTPMERARYAEVLQACALVPDLLTLPAGDQTEIGEKGVNLSGGQRQRVSLARAVYSSADLFLLDDPLSAVDAHVAKHLFSHVVGPRGLLKGKTRVLVTHSVSVLPLVDVVVVLTAGRISEVGPYQQLVSEGRDFAEFLRAFAGHPGPAGPTEETAEHDTGTVLEEDELAPLDPCPRADEVPGDMVTMMLRRHSSQRIRSASTRLRAASMRSETQSVYVATAATATAAEETTGKSATLIERENIETGNVKMRVYLQYVRAMGPVFPLLILAGYFLQTVASIAQNFWLSAWTGDAQSTTNTTAANATANDADKPTVSAGVRIAVYGVLGLAQGMAVLLGSVMTAVGTIRAARVQHSGLLHNVLRLPMAFFDTTPMGRIVNRFAKDMNTIDEMIPMSVRPWLISLFSVLGTVVVICVATPVFTAIVVPLAILYFFLQRFYMKTSRQLRRLDAVSRSPVYSHLEETVQGLGVIRAYGHAERFLRHNESLVQHNQLCVFPWVVSNRWLSIRLDVVGALVVFFSSLFAVLARGAVDGAIVGLSISYSLTVHTHTYTC
ncbi:ATP-binding cassette sub-family C member 2-like [Lampetra fluviatilis]